MFLPLLQRIPIVTQPDPTNALEVGKLVARHKISIMFGTSTFLRLYIKQKKCLPVMFKSLRMVVAGAEKLQEQVRVQFKEKFGLDIYEGYGATETTPVASVNIPDTLNTAIWLTQEGSKPGTVGLPVPGTMIKIVNPENFEPLALGDSGMILISGIQIMKGYLKDQDKTKEAIYKYNGFNWYVTGDRGHLNDDGFLTIEGRFSRFAKIGGEMVSLTAVDEFILNEAKIPELDVFSASFPDEKKGEKIITLYSGDIEPDMLSSKIKQSDINPLWIPVSYHKVDEIPKLGTGKTDLKSAKVLLEEFTN